MGTRNLTMVINQKGEKKVAQYGQWDGYPSHLGINILNILKNDDIITKLKTNLSKVRFIEEEGTDKEFIESYDKNAPICTTDPDNRTEAQKQWFLNYGSRDLAEKVLINISNSNDNEILLLNRESTAKKCGWVEYSYVINLKTKTFGIYRQIDQKPLKVYKLNQLPEESIFLSDLEEKE